jgi:phosphoglycerate dehydrogenase-like enzyme
MKIAVAVTALLQERIFPASAWTRLAELGDIARTGELPQIPRGAEVLITSWGCPPLTGEILAAAPDLRLVVYAAGSVKGIVTPDLWRAGIRLSSAAGPLSKGVAETALGMTIAALKNLWRLDSAATAGGWHDERGRVRELYDITIGVIGAGHAGRQYLELLRPFDAELLVYDPYLPAEQANSLGAHQVSLPELLRRSDVVALHAPSIPETRHMIDAAALELLKPDAILLNTARGALIDEDALVAKLRSGRLYAVLDVTDPEPPAPDHPFRTLPNCVLTGHVAGAVNNGLSRLGRHAVAEIESYVDGRPLAGEVYESQLPTLA